MLLGVSVADRRWVEMRAHPACELLLETEDGQILVGHASLVGCTRGPGSLRLIGTSLARAS